MPQHTTRRMMALAMGMGLSMGWAGGAHAAGFNSGSTGADGALNVTTNTTLVMPESGVFNFTTVTIASGATLSFKRNVANTPVVMLATGDVNIVGTIDVSGTASVSNSPGALGDTSLPGLGGPGGFDGGRGGVPANSRRAGNGLGPGGGGGGDGIASCCISTSYPNHPQGGGGGGHTNAGTSNYFWATWGSTPGWNVGNTGVGGGAYGSNLLIPLVGGSGGGGGGGSASTTGAYGTGGGGGGGALLIAASGTVNVAGTIKATGGNSGATSNCTIATTCGASGGGGSGGAVRILASTISGAGTVNVAGGATGASSEVRGGAGSIGRVRYDVMSAGTLTLSGLPTLAITSVAGIAAPATPTGLQDIVLPENTPNPVAVTLATTGVPAGNVVTLTLTPKRGAASTATSTALTGSTAGATATANIDVPTDISTLSAAVTYTVTVAMGEALANFAQNERVEKISVSATAGGTSRAMLVTASGKEFEAPPAALLIAGIVP